ncbi:MAG TPA: SUMF1/EgtB/PvdO family nonheme iron enzyme [Bacteroidales bacterium]|nr:SUMF1/EgtB/PvdO family nonheme iron enzyme [Bacteroidales bacterium]
MKTNCPVIRSVLAILFILISNSAESQKLHNINFADTAGLRTSGITLSDSTTILFIRNRPLICFLLNDKIYTSGDINASKDGGQYSLVYENRLRVTFKEADLLSDNWSGEFIFENISDDTLSLSNVVPFGTDNESVYITGKGPWDLARAWLFRPGYRPVRVIMPDNAWEMGYSSFNANNGYSVCAIARRQTTEGGQKQRYTTILPPGAKIKYAIYADIFKGEWQNGLRLMFRDRYLYDLETFNNTLYERADLAWIKESYLIILQMAWDKDFYDRFTGKYTYPEVIKKSTELFGHIDVFGIWPTWPRLGLDQRNQWDMYRDLPGGTVQLRNFVRMSHQSGTKFFIAYNPWDNSTRKEDHYRGMAQLISETEADGVVLDTRGSSSYELQAAADSVRKGVIMYSEGMAVTRDMPGIISGRVHNAIFYSPELNLNKLIKPDFSIFRVCDVGEDIVHREIAIAFFNGYGTELNMFRPGGRDENYKADLEYLANTTFILRQNNDAFMDKDWTPLIDTEADNVFVNRWKAGDKTIYTVLNMRPEGIEGKLFRINIEKSKHFVSLWNHENIEPLPARGTAYISARASGWPASYSGTRKEGSVDCIAELPDILNAKLSGDSISIEKPGLGRVRIWQGNPSYQTPSRELRIINDTVLRVKDLFGYYEGKIVIQLIENKRLKDENILYLKGGKPWLVSKVAPTTKASDMPLEMVMVPGTLFSYNVTTDEDFMPYPEVSGISVKVDSFLIDKYPVTNANYYEFLISSGYRPADTAKYLHHWQSGTYKLGQDKYPVVYVSYEDMMAYARWAGKRLPAQAEWQLAAQGTDKRKWPWGNDFHGTFCNNAFDRPTPVDAFLKGQSPYGVMDLVGNVWQMTNDMYFNGTNYFMVIRGGSFYKPDSSWWYIKGGPQPLDRTQIMLMVSPGFDRSATVGFRCVKDIDSKNFRSKR